MIPARFPETSGPARFTRWALATSAVWLLCIYPLLNCFAWDHLPLAARSNGSDFGQYYAGALAVRTNMRECLYPQPDPRVYAGAPTFRPTFITPLFNPEADASRTGKWAFYPQIAEPGASRVSEKLTAQYPRLQGDWHYIYPPPLALLLAPLAYFDFNTACRAVWFTLMCASLFGISYYSSRICRILFSRVTYAEAATVLLPAIPTWLASGLGTSLSIGNVSPLIGFLVSLTAYAFLTRKQSLIALCVIPLILFKGIGITWCPLLLMGRKKWKTIFLMGFLTLTINAVALYIGGPGLYQTFFREILPKAGVPLGIGVQGVMMSLLGVDSRTAATVARVAVLLLIYSYHYKALRRGHDDGAVSLTSVIAIMALFNLLNPVVWPHYFTNYLVLPFAPWIMREIYLRQGKTRTFLTILASATALCWLDSVFLIKKSLVAVWLKNLNLYSPAIDTLRQLLSGISFYVIPNAVTLLIFILALRRLKISSDTKTISDVS